MTEEIFAPIPGFPGYFVGDTGTVISTRRGRAHQMRPLHKSNGYVSINLCSPGAAKRTLTVHPLVAHAFIGPRPEGLIVLHGDGDPRNNSVQNLRWGTHEENFEDAVRHGTKRRSASPRPGPRGPMTHCKRGHPFDEQNTYIQSEGRRRCRTCHRWATQNYKQGRTAVERAA